MSATGTINDPANPTVASVTPSTVTEGTNLVHTVTLSAATTQPATYAFSLANGTATAPGDYTNAPTFSNGVTLVGGVLTVPAGVTSFTVSYPTIVDALADTGETTTVTVGGVSATGTINDPLTDMVANVSGLPIAATVGASYTGTYTCTNSGITAALGATCVIANLPPGLTSNCSPAQPANLVVGASITCTVTGIPTATGVFAPIVTASATNEGNPANNSAGTTITIGVITVTIGNATTVAEGGLLVYPVTLSQASATNTVVTIALSGTATPGVDYTAPALTVTIPAGQVSVNVSVPSINDVQNEVTETVVIAITGVTSGTVSLGVALVGTGNINDDDVDLIPVANDDVTVFTEGAPVSGTVVGNDTSGNGPSVFNLVTGPSNGSLVFNPDGSFTYTSNPGFVGNDSFVYQLCDSDTPPDCDNATVTLTVLPRPNKLRLLKEVNPKNVTAGSLVSYTLTVQNIGAIPVIGANVVDTPPAGFNLVPGSVVIVDTDNAGTASGTGPITFAGIDVPVGGTATIRYLLRVSAGLPSGEFINEATVFQFGVAVSNSASAAVTMGGGTDPLFEQSRIWGKVWDDKDGDGWQDEGEKGIPGVRVATVEGLIGETDSKGRYHFEGLTLSNQERGQNFVVKVDKSTLPEGGVFTTENPLLRRVTPAVPVRFDFGVKLPPPPKVIAPEPEAQPIAQPATSIELGSVYFDTDRTTIKSEYTGKLDAIAKQIETTKGGTVILTGYADLRGSDQYNLELALRRAKAVWAYIASRLSPEAKANLKVEAEAAEMVPGAGK